MDRKSQISQFIIEELLLGQDDIEIEGDTSLIAEGIIDSMGMIQLVSFLEERFQLQIANEDMKPEHFRSVDAIDQFVTARVK